MKKSTADATYLLAPRWIEDCGSIVFCHDDFKRDDPNCDMKISCKASTATQFCTAGAAADKRMMSNDAASYISSSSSSPDLFVPYNAPDLIMMQNQVSLNRLLLQRQQHLYLMSERTKQSRALLHGRMW